MRVPVDFRTDSVANYKDFRKKHPTLKLTRDEWRNIIYTFNESFREYILETGDVAKLPFGLGEFSIQKKKRKTHKMVNGIAQTNLPIDWKKTKEKGKRIYNFNYHTEGYFFGWLWFRMTARFKLSDLWYFKASRTTSRLLKHYVTTNDQYQHIYREWKKR
jgi:hypothetical protein